ncbi:unnamed protein product [Brassicogethes aeneus]|uniref:Uncharacterized protein n=1 Tax=Brassicogethes aeneus TaxID=1431903 RepID=A0A9P0FKP3_BRAAE|nr:unnamed protein product [Brassicogethes aeneus]
MKHKTISSSSLNNEEKKSNFTIYADMDILNSKVNSSNSEVDTVKGGELEIVQKALKYQTKRCRQLVGEYTRKLQEKEQQFHTERMLRDDQLAKVLRALLMFEARLKQEQKFITHQLQEKDDIISRQNNHIKKLISNQFCKNCSKYYNSSPVQESLDSSSENAGIDNDYQSSNFESLDSSSETNTTFSENCAQEDFKIETESIKNKFKKNKNRDSYGRRSKKLQHRKSIGTYFEVLKLRNDSASPESIDDNTSNDYDRLDSLPPESVTDKISIVSESIENHFNKNQESFYTPMEPMDLSAFSPNVSECNDTVIIRNIKNEDSKIPEKISETIPDFGEEGETNENWYASASDQEDEEHRDVYRNNPVLECMNQILLQNINLNSPPKTPNVERKAVKNNKKVKFSDDESPPNKEVVEKVLIQENVDNQQNYYETPIQKSPNYYETPQSIYSNDYEQILSKCNESFSDSINKKEEKKPNDNDYFYVEMETEKEPENIIVRKMKILRTPPALPPKPTNLVSKYKLKAPPKIEIKDKHTDTSSEPDYCSISELNLPTKSLSFKKISVVAEINSPTSNDVRNKLEKPDVKPKKPVENSDYDPVMVNCEVPNLIVRKCVEKFNIQVAKQTPIKSEVSTATVNLKSPKKIEPEIPKLPQVSEIIIPDEVEEPKEQERITQDNYVKNNTQFFKTKTPNESRRPIIIGSSVSSLITGFNNHKLLSEIKKSPDCNKLDKSLFSSFENLQNLGKQDATRGEPETPNFENYDLSQNFEEFKLDDCDIEEYNVDMSDISISSEKSDISPIQSPTKNNLSKVEIIRAKNDLNIPDLNKCTVELLRKQLESQKILRSKSTLNSSNNEPSYEHFLECTGLSTKSIGSSILTPSRLVSNHKTMLKPKDVKLRSKVKAINLIERHSTSAIKYWSEPFI